MPGDGSCLFHSVGHHLNKSAHKIREEVVEWYRKHLDDTKVSGLSIREWLQHEAGSAEEYIRQMERHGAWGGGTEMSTLTIMHPELSFHVCSRLGDGDLYERIAVIGDGPKEVWITWSGSHYDALERVTTPTSTAL